jgi:hypothetical protein
VLLRKARAFDKIDQNWTNLKARTLSGQKCGISRAFLLKNCQNYDLWTFFHIKNEMVIIFLLNPSSHNKETSSAG